MNKRFQLKNVKNVHIDFGLFEYILSSISFYRMVINIIGTCVCLFNSIEYNNPMCVPYVRKRLRFLAKIESERDREKSDRTNPPEFEELLTKTTSKTQMEINK